MCASAEGVEKSTIAVFVGFVMTENRYGQERASIPSSSSSRALSCPNCSGFMRAVGGDRPFSP